MIERLIEAVEMIELKKRGRNAAVAKATGYSPAMISAVFSGKEPLNDKLLSAICSAYSINEDWVRTGHGPTFGSKKTRINNLYDKLKVDPEDVIDRLTKLGYVIQRKDPPPFRINDMTPAYAGLPPVPPPNGFIPVVSLASANGDGPCWEDAYPVGHGLEMVYRPHDVTDPKAFGVKIDGDSMIPAFRPGDTVVVCPEKQVVNGDDVVAKLVDGRVVVKVIRYLNGHVLLESYNSTHDPIFVERDQIEFAYKVVWHKRG